MIDRRLVAFAPATVDQSASVEQRLDGAHPPVDVALVLLGMESNHIDHFLVRNDPGGQADSYVLNKHKESMKKY
jgi:hypothetical protein